MTALDTARTLGLSEKAVAGFSGSAQEFARHFGVDDSEAPASPPPVVVTEPTGLSAGTPGGVVPPGATVPANLAAIPSTVKGVPGTVWTTGQYVVLGDASHVYWDGLAWVAGEAP